jgi:radical SAM protein with 4Fe4S-binding SPASM domain
LCTHEAKQALDALAEMQVFTVAFGGGEPLARPDLFELAEHAHQLNLTPTVTTNGFYIDESVAARCRVFSHIHVSLDGVGTRYKAVRGTDGFPRAAQAIELLVAAGNSVGVNCVVGRANYEHLEELAEFLAEHGVNDLILLRLKPGGRAYRNYQATRMTPEQGRGLFPLIRRLSRRNRLKPHVDCAMMPFVYWHRPKRNILERWSLEGCVGASEIIEIDPAGQVRACSFAPTSACQIADLPAQWQRAAQFLELRSWSGRAPEPCRSCIYLDLCRGGCRALAQTLTGDPDAPDPECPYVIEAQQTTSRAELWM